MISTPDTVQKPKMHVLTAGQFISQWVLKKVSTTNRPAYYRAFPNDTARRLFLETLAETERQFNSVVLDAWQKYYHSCHVVKPTFRDYLIYNPYINEF